MGVQRTSDTGDHGVLDDGLRLHAISQAAIRQAGQHRRSSSRTANRIPLVEPGWVSVATRPSASIAAPVANCPKHATP